MASIMTHVLTSYSRIAIFLMVVMYAFLITEKFQRVLVVGVTAMLVIILQVLSQDEAFMFISNNLGIL
jgi:Na+/H+ antiporter NhaD/arsenite permease-like protein